MQRGDLKKRVKESRFTPKSTGQIGRPFSENEMREHFQWLETPINALETPLPTWNGICGDDGGTVGVAQEWFVIIGGPPGAGKTLLAMNTAAGAMRSGNPVGYVKLEMSDQQIRSRIYSILTGRDSKLFEKRPDRQADLNPEAKQAIRDAWAEVPDGADLLYNRFTIRQKEHALSEMANWASTYGVDTFFVDFVQRIRDRESGDLRKRFQEISGDLADFAEQCGVRVIGVSQLKNSAAEAIAQGEKKPTQHDLYGGMAVAQEANQTLIFDHGRYERPPPGDSRRYAHTVLSVVKNKHGDSPDIDVRWDYQSLRIRELMPDELEEYGG